MCPESRPTRRPLFVPAVLLAVLLLFITIFPPSARARREHIVHFSNTVYELNIFKIYGKQPGKTLMLIGGIQGNEPGGFLSADLYADMRLERGNLIVVPRANFHSIILNQRGVNGDMNRKFAKTRDADTMEDRIVEVLKELISESDYLLNLHDGSGYYHPTYIDKWRNPMRFGQSIIADCETYSMSYADRVIRLGDMARQVIEAVNPRIDNELHRFHFMNTKTDEDTSPHREQRMSATYYALTQHRIPAFGVETSKFLPSVDLKVRYHNLIINEFMRVFGIVPESPGLVLDPPSLKYVVVSVNGQIPIVLKDSESLVVSPGDTINVTHVEANYERGLSLDILGCGDLSDIHKDFRIDRNTSIIIRKDNQTFAEIPVTVSKGAAPGTRAAARPSAAATEGVDSFVVEALGRKILIENGGTLDLVRGDTLKITDVIPSMGPDRVTVNFKGFVGDWKNNTGEDRGYVVQTNEKALIGRYALNQKGNVYEVVATRNSDEKLVGRFLVRLHPARMNYLLLRLDDQRLVGLKPGDSLSLNGIRQVRLEDVRTNLFCDDDITLRINGHTLKRGEHVLLTELRGGGEADLGGAAVVQSGPSVLGEVYLRAE